MIAFTVNGQDLTFDQNKLDLAEACAVKAETGQTIAQFNQGLTQLDPHSLWAMVWLSKRRNGDKVRFQDISFDVVAVINSIQYEKTPGEAADPTEAPTTPTGSNNGTTPSNVEPSTSEPLPTI